MKNIAIVICLVVVGAAAAVIYLKASRSSTPEAQTSAETANSEVRDSGSELLHGASAAEAAARPKCAKHGIPDAICAFCHPELAQKLGFCKGHDVAEAFCTRCSPVLIAAFKVEGDWCAEHGLPESQCKICKGEQPAPPPGT